MEKNTENEVGTGDCMGELYCRVRVRVDCWKPRPSGGFNIWGRRYFILWRPNRGLAPGVCSNATDVQVAASLLCLATTMAG